MAMLSLFVTCQYSFYTASHIEQQKKKTGKKFSITNNQLNLEKSPLSEKSINMVKEGIFKITHNSSVMPLVM